MIALIYSIINEGSIEPVLQKQILPEHFIGEAQNYYRWILEFYNKYKKVPSKQAFEEQFNIKIEDTPDPLDYYVDKFVQNLDRVRMYEYATQVVHKLADLKEPQQIKDLMTYIVTQSAQFTERVVKSAPIVKVSDILEDYLKTDIPPVLQLPWRTIDSLTGGIKQGEFWVIVGRPNIGKTYLVLTALKNWFDRNFPYPLLIVSPEMTSITLLHRLMAIIYSIHIDQFRFKTEQAKEFINSKIQEWKDIPLFIVDKVHDVNQIETYISYYKPKLVVIDSVYLLRDSSIQSGKSALWETIAAVLSKLRLFVLKYDIGLIVTSQLSRNIGEFSPIASLNDLSYTDVFSQLADYIIGITATQELRDQKLRQIKLMKARHSNQTSVTINFKFSPSIDFSEIGSVVMQSMDQQSNNVIDY